MVNLIKRDVRTSQRTSSWIWAGALFRRKRLIGVSDKRHCSRTRPGRTASPQQRINTDARVSASIPTTLFYPPTKMYVAGIMDHFSDAPRMELIVWSSTVGIFTSSAFRIHRQLKRARSKTGNPKPGSTGPRFWIDLALLGQLSTLTLPPLIYWTTIAYNKFQQPEWMTEHALPSPPDVLGVDGIMAGRVVGLLGLLAGMVLSRAAMKALGDQFEVIGVSPPFFTRIANVKAAYVCSE